MRVADGFDQIRQAMPTLSAFRRPAFYDFFSANLHVVRSGTAPFKFYD
jgi:hypothetical protein